MFFHSGLCIYSNFFEKNTLFLKPEFKLEVLLNYSYEAAFKSFEQKTNTAKTFDIEWLLRIAGTKQISQALNLTKPEEGSPCLFLTKKRFEIPKSLKLKDEKAFSRELWVLQRTFFKWNGCKEDLELDLIEQRALIFS